MFRVRTLLINSFLAFFDLAFAATSYLAVLWGAMGASGDPVSWPQVLTGENILALGWVLGIWLGLLCHFGMYHSRRTASVFADLGILVKVAITGTLALGALAHIAPALRPSPLFPVCFAAFSLLVLSAVRVGVRFVLRELRRRGHNTKNLLVVSAPALGDRLARKIAIRAHYGYRLLRRWDYVDPGEQAQAELLEEFRRFLSSNHIDDVMVALPAEARSLTARLVEECENRGIQVRLVPDLFPLIQSDTQVYDLDGIPLINVRLYPTENLSYVVLKRIFDVVVSLALFLVLTPLFLLIALVIKLTSTGPIFFVQERVGLNGRKFRMLKFRTMVLREESDSDTHWTLPGDPNVTPVGRWLRRSNLDELPQFLNVLKGDMSLVGPRPERPYFIERFRGMIPDYMLRHYVKCGITGWAQVNGWRGDTSIRQRLAHDLYYIRNWALSFDLKILFLTVARSFFHRNAY